MVKVKSQGTLVLPFPRIKDLLRSVDTDNSKFQKARSAVLEKMGSVPSGSSVESIDFEVTGNRVIVTCETTGTVVKETFKQSFDAVYSSLSQLLSLSLSDSDIENEDTLMAVRDIAITGVEE